VWGLWVAAVAGAVLVLVGAAVLVRLSSPD
jgi:hypothetical protein